MYATFFGLKQTPFSIAPDPRYLFMSERHREALAHLLYGLGGGGGFVLLTGEIGAGKTTVCRCFLEQVPRRCNVAYIFNPKLSVVELLRTVCDEFHVPYQPGGAMPATVKDHLDPLNEYLLRTHAVGQDNVLIIDEAQSLGADVLEQLRLLTNLETSERKLLQIILIGQPELRAMLARPELEQLAQRVVARFHLEPLAEAETAQYIGHRLAVAGHGGVLPFDAAALKRIHALTGGVPRRINLLCDRALLGAYARGTLQVGRGIVDQAAREVFGPGGAAMANGAAVGSRAAFVALGLVLGGVFVGLLAFALDARRTPARAASAGAGAGAAPPSVASAAVTAALAPPGRADASAFSASARPAAAASPVTTAGASAAWADAPQPLAAADLRQRFSSLSSDEKQAWRDLAPLWKLTLGDGDPCQAAERAQVHCFRSSGSNLALIRQLGRPGIVTLHDENDAPVYALLTGLTATRATLRIGGVAQAVSLPSLARLWRGDFATYWRVPPGYDKGLVDAASGAPAEWLEAQLAKLDDGGPPPAEASWKSRIAAFQLAHGLKADGLAGPTTFMQLNRASGIDEPRLQTESAERSRL